MYSQDAFLEKHGVKLGFMSAFVKASSEALMAIPAVSSPHRAKPLQWPCGTAVLRDSANSSN
jgi:hypothetical protein